MVESTGKPHPEPVEGCGGCKRRDQQIIPTLRQAQDEDNFDAWIEQA